MVSKQLALMDSILEVRKIALSEPKIAYKKADEYRIQAKAVLAKEQEAAALFVMALSSRSMTKLEECYNHAYDALKLYEELEHRDGQSESLNLIGIVYFYYGMYEQALEYFLKALYLIEDTDQFLILSRIYNNKGEVYREVGNEEEALKAFEKARDICEKHDFKHNLGVILENIGEIYYNRQNYAESYQYLQKSYAILKELSDTTSLAEVENKIGRIYFHWKEFDKARTHFENSLKRLEFLGNKFYIIEVLINLAESALLDSEEEFLALMKRALSFAEDIEARKSTSKIFKRLSEYYEQTSEYKHALDYYKKYHHVEQAIETSAVSQKLEIIKIELNKVFAGKEVEKMAKVNEQLEYEISTQKKMLTELEQANVSLHGEAYIDELTQVCNRRAVMKYLNDLWKSEEKSSNLISLLMFDIDFFKHYNDMHGHVEGDKCLKAVAATLKNELSSVEGIVGRYGGEEFVAVLESVSLDVLNELTDRIRQSVSKLPFSFIKDAKTHPVTISIGAVHGKRNEFGQQEEMFVKADGALYRSKSGGRNRTTIMEQ
ncbi:diguanylate cyclase domain-containing protein [Paenisporosarcina cavernae]|uniref:Diguanylate cyclase n=1 Tax=Paenisporosarcina cavernae TaxID=2320858 RepID=A0A385YSW3_9BACL|nr:diguanylate cyclase [Paenisporosarcina cavernae]AYC28533.1 diguanylate cyclase [Paenisporosarcina cavernae]